MCKKKEGTLFYSALAVVLLGIASAPARAQVCADSGGSPCDTIIGDFPQLFFNDVLGPDWFIDAQNFSHFSIGETGVSVPLLIESGGPSDSLWINSSGDVGLGTAVPGHPFHVLRSTNIPTILLELENNGPVQFSVHNTDHTDPWTFNHSNSGRFILNGDATAADGPELTLTTGGDLTVSGDVFSSTCTSPGSPCAPDYVYDPGYELESIDEHAAFMWDNSHLPAVGPGQGQVALTRLSYGMLEELEKAHIYIERLNERLKDKESQVDELTERLARLESLLIADRRNDN